MYREGEMRKALTVLLLVFGLAAIGGLTAGAAGSAHGVAGGFVRNYGGWCQAKSSASWKRVLSGHIVALSRTTPLRAMALANGGHSFFAQIFTPSFTGVAEINATTGAVTQIRAFPDQTPATPSEQGDQAWGAFDGRWLVWNEYRGQTDFNNFTTWAWDTQTRKLTKIGAAKRAPNGQFWESPWRGPDVRDGIATWAQGVGPDQRGQVHTYNLRTGRDLVIRRGHPSGALMLANHVVAWTESPTRGARTKMYTANALTGKRLPTPKALRYTDGVSGLYTDGHHIAYPSPHYKSLWWSPSLQKKPREILATKPLAFIDNDVQINGHYIGFGIQPPTGWPHIYVANTKTHRYVEMYNHGGSTLINRTMLLVSYGPDSKLDPIDRIAIVPLHDLPAMPACT